MPLRLVPRPLFLAFCLLFFLLPGWVGAQDQPLVTQIDVVGARKVEEATVRFKLKTRVGDAYSPEVVREDIKSLYSLGYFEDIVVQADIFEGGLKLSFVLHEKPSIQSITIVGAKKLAADKVKGKIDLVEGAIVPPGSLTKNADKIRLFYEEEGYYQARVEGARSGSRPRKWRSRSTSSKGTSSTSARSGSSATNISKRRISRGSSRRRSSSCGSSAAR